MEYADTLQRRAFAVHASIRGMTFPKVRVRATPILPNVSFSVNRTLLPRRNELRLPGPVTT
jgi:hypothetical protein